MVFGGWVEPLDPTSSHLRAHTSVAKKTCQAKKLRFHKGIPVRPRIDDPWGQISCHPTRGGGIVGRPASARPVVLEGFRQPAFDLGDSRGRGGGGGQESRGGGGVSR